MPQWVAIDVGIESNRKVLTLAALLEWNQDQALQFMTRLLIAVRTDAVDGDVSGWSGEDYAALARVSPERGTCIMNALVRSRIATQDDGRVYITGWMKRNGLHLREAIRLRAYRKRTRTDTVRTRSVRHRTGEQEQEKLPTSAIADGVGVDLFSVEAQKQERAKELDREWEGAFGEHFWPVYPRKVAKAAALKAWKPIIRGVNGMDTAEKLLGRVMDGLERDIATEWRGRDPDKIPHAATWLGQRRWEDER